MIQNIKLIKVDMTSLCSANTLLYITEESLDDQDPELDSRHAKLSYQDNDSGSTQEIRNHIFVNLIPY